MAGALDRAGRPAALRAYFPAMSRTAPGPGRKAAPPVEPRRGPALAPFWLAVLVAAAGSDVYRLGFFADDFLFLDAVRRWPVWQVLLGRHGVFPWYRPLSRELYFYAVSAAGPAGPAVARTLSLVCLFAAAWLLWKIAGGLTAPDSRARPSAAVSGAEFVAPAAACLLLASGFAKFLAGWASGFQDLLAVPLELLAVFAHQRGRRGWALIAAGLAPFAKETGLIVAPLLVAYTVLVEGERRFRPWMLWQGVVAACVVAVHIAVRVYWHVGARLPAGASTPLDLPSGLAQFAAGFVPAGIGPGGAAWLPALLAAGASAAFLAAGARGRTGAMPDSSSPVLPRRRIGTFLVVAIILGVLPLLVGAFSGLARAHAYYAFTAAPWAALLAARALARLPRVPTGIGLSLLVGLNVWSLGYRPPDLDVQAGWEFRRLNWAEDVRLSAATARLRTDLSAILAGRPDSLVILFYQLPTGCFFQGGDGPAVRVTLGDPTLRSFYQGLAPPHLRSDRLAIVAFRRPEMHLALVARDDPLTLEIAMSQFVMGHAASSEAWIAYARAADSQRFDLRYLLAAAALALDGPRAYADSLARIGLADTTGDAPHRLASENLAGQPPGLVAAYEAALRRPLTARAHEALAESLSARADSVLGAMELRLAVSLEPGDAAARARLGLFLTRTGSIEPARAELSRALEGPLPEVLAARARAALGTLPAAGDRGLPPGGAE